MHNNGKNKILKTSRDDVNSLCSQGTPSLRCEQVNRELGLRKGKPGQLVTLVAIQCKKRKETHIGATQRRRYLTNPKASQRRSSLENTGLGLKIKEAS